jgi:hypothetical protein
MPRENALERDQAWRIEMFDDFCDCRRVVSEDTYDLKNASDLIAFGVELQKS